MEQQRLREVAQNILDEPLIPERVLKTIKADSFLSAPKN